MDCERLNWKGPNITHQGGLLEKFNRIFTHEPHLKDYWNDYANEHKARKMS